MNSRHTHWVFPQHEPGWGGYFDMGSTEDARLRIVKLSQHPRVQGNLNSLPHNVDAMNLHLVEIAAEVAPGARDLLMVDQAERHMSGRLIVPSNITLVSLPPKCPTSTRPNIRYFMRDNWLSNRIFESYDDFVGRCCGAWNKLIDQSWRIMSIGLCERANGS